VNLELYNKALITSIFEVMNWKLEVKETYAMQVFLTAAVDAGKLNNESANDISATFRLGISWNK
jgi:hypothetical protein